MVKRINLNKPHTVLDDQSVISRVDTLLRHAIRCNASDIHLEQMREKSWKYGIRDAASVMAKYILDIAKESRR